jgi:alanine racemase
LTARLTIDLAALAANYHQLVRDASGAEVAAVVKADGYGLGAGPVSKRLAKEGVGSFFVARASEGLGLRRALGGGPVIYVLDGVAMGTEQTLREADLTPALTAPDQATRWRDRSFALHVDTGMNRLGVSVAEALALADAGLKPDLVMSHLGRGEDGTHPKNAEQLGRFQAARRAFPQARASLAASSGVYLGPDYRMDMVRPGISLFGGGPLEVPDPRFAAVARLEADILQIRDLKVGEAAGYGAMFTAERDLRLAIIGAGYADGVIRAAHGKGYGVVDGVRCPFAIVTMDLIGLDITAAPAAKVGDIAELLGPRALLDDLAKAAGSVAHECLVRLGGRAERRYTH